MARKDKKPTLVSTIDVSEVASLLSRVEGVVQPEDYEQLRLLVETLVELTRLVRERGTTISRLRRLFGLSGSERTSDVLKREEDSAQPKEATERDEASQAGHGEAAIAPAPAATGGDRPGVEAGKPQPKKKDGHGRIPSSAYATAQRHSLAHEDISAGEVCPSCACGKIHPLKDPARIVRIVGQAPLVAHRWELERLRCGACGEVFTAAAPEEARGPKYTETAASMLALLHYGLGMPFHRLAKLQRDLRILLPASTQWDVVNECAELVRAPYDELVRRAAQGILVHNDDTHMGLLEYMGKRRARLLEQGDLLTPERTGLFTTGIVALTGEKHPIALFFTGRSHAGENLKTVLDQRASDLPPPIHMSDALACNSPEGHAVFAGNCLAHGRRGVVGEIENFPQECRLVLELLCEVFKHDVIAKDEKMSDDDRLRFHQRHSGPVMGRLKKWINTQFRERRIEPNCGFGVALRYIKTHWKKLTLFLRRAGVPLTNNICERVLKMAITHRKNSYFYRSERGALVGDIFMSLICTAELHGENPFEYLTALQLHAKAAAESPGDWLPWNFRATLARAVEPHVRRDA